MNTDEHLPKKSPEEFINYIETIFTELNYPPSYMFVCWQNFLRKKDSFQLFRPLLPVGNPKHFPDAYKKYGHIIKNYALSFTEAELKQLDNLILREIDKLNQHGGIQKTNNPKPAIMLNFFTRNKIFIIIFLLLIIIAITITAISIKNFKKSEIKVNIDYNIGEIIGASLAGLGIATAGFAYAAKVENDVNKNNNPPPSTD